MTKKIVILGGGFGGVYTFLNLKKYFNSKDVEVLLVNNKNYFLFTPLLHEVATGGLNQIHVVESLREILKGYKADLLQAEIQEIDLKNKIVKTTLCNVSYDYLVVALGATTNFFNTPGAFEHSLVLKSIDDAVKLRDKFIDAFEFASKVQDMKEREKLLSFAVVGGGATGVELAAEISEFIYETFSTFYKTLSKEAKIYLFNSDKELLMQFHPTLRSKSLEILKKKGIEVILDSAVKEVTENGVVIDNDKVFEARNVIWVAGVKPNIPKFSESLELDKSGRLVVDEYLRVKGHENVFALGDVASVITPSGKPLPMLAQIAVEESKYVALNIKNSISLKSLKKVTDIKLKGSLVSLGQWEAVGDILGFQVWGPHIWWLWRTIYLFKFISFAKKFKIALDWTYNIFYPRDISKID